MRVVPRLAVVLIVGAVLTAIGAKVHADAQDLLLRTPVDAPVVFDPLVPATAEAEPKPAVPAKSVAARRVPAPKGKAAPPKTQVPAQGRVDLGPWATAMSAKVDIPEVALAAYGAAELRLATENPGCHLSWVALAGIGSVESNHGRFGGAVLRADGTSWPPIIGVALDGAGVGHVRDSDAGALDGDPTYDRAVGPMQFLPGTWKRWAADGDGDGVANPFSLPDAALAAGRYLCAVGGDLRQAGPWRAALWYYNRSDAYAANVTGRSHAYAAASLQ
jgi:membrane-bound lytic murein transglycosylase B